MCKTVFWNRLSKGCGSNHHVDEVYTYTYVLLTGMSSADTFLTLGAWTGRLV